MRYRTFEIPYEGTVYDVQISIYEDDVYIEEVRTVAHRPNILSVMDDDVKSHMLGKIRILLSQPVLHEQETMDREGE